MQEFCHRCGGELPAGKGESPFCPQCGTPQLFLSMENQSVETGGEPAVDAAGVASTGALPPPQPRQVEWKTAILCAAAVAGIGSMLSLLAMRVDALSPVSLLWIMSASLITLGLYQKRRPAAWIDVRVGARIGLMVGLCLALGLGISMAGWGLVARFGLHSMGSFDAQMAAQLQKTIQQQLTPPPPELVRLFTSPEGRAGIMLAGFAMVSAFLLALSTLGGAFAGLVRMRRGTVL
ncbi:MAG TPA: zinc ribbon domain-containing protein [Acidobacteriaceae bacterium]